MALLATAMLSSGAIAANARDVYFGSPEPGGSGGGIDPDTGAIVPGILTNTTVTSGGRTSIIVRIQNRGGQALNHVKWAAGTTAEQKSYNPLFPAPDLNDDDVIDSSLSGATVTRIFNPAGTTCDPATGASVQCEVGSLAANAAKEFQVILTPPTAPASYKIWFTASWNEGWSSTGTNADYTFALGTIDVKGAACGNGMANYFLPEEQVTLNDNSGDICNGADASVKSGGFLNANGNGGFASLKVDETGIFDGGCPVPYECFGNTVTVNILDGGTVPGKVDWTVTWYGTKSLGAVIHYFDTYSLTNLGAYKAIPLTKKNKCSASLLTDCWLSFEASKGNANPIWFKVVFRTDGNGKAGGGF